MPIWKVAGVQMDCLLGQNRANTEVIIRNLTLAAGSGAKFIIFPECILSGYGFESRQEVLSVAETIPGTATDAISLHCAKLGVWVAFGLFERDSITGKLFNACVLLGPDGQVHSYRKTHLPCLGADRFTDPGDRPFAVHDLGGLKVGLSICFDGSFPETARILTLLGADLVVLPTNWATNARKMAELVSPARAWENHIYFMAVNRIGDESGFHYIGLSSAADYLGNVLSSAAENEFCIFTIDVDPLAARQKRVVHCHGVYEIDRVNWRRPELYGTLVLPQTEPFTGHMNGNERV